MNLLGNGLSAANHDEESLSLKETELALMRRLGDSESNILVMQGNLANSYYLLGRLEEALRMRRDVYSGRLKLSGEEHPETIREATNYAASLVNLQHFKEARALLRKTMPVARRVLGEGHRLTLKMRWTYAQSLYEDPNATLDDLREAVTTLEDAGRIARRVFGGAHPLTSTVEGDLRSYRAALRASEKKFNLKLLDEKEDA